MEAFEQWEKIVESTLRLINTTQSTPLRLEMQEKPLRYWLPHKSREIAEIEAPLRKLFRNLVSGLASWPLSTESPGRTKYSNACLRLPK